VNKFTAPYSVIATLAILVLFALLGRGCKDASNQEAISKQNIKALTDTITVTKLKNKGLQYEKGILFVNKTELEKINSDLKKELDKVKGGKPEIIIKTDIKYIGVNLSLDNQLMRLEDGSLGLKFKHSTQSRELEGISKFRLVETPNTKDTPGKIDIIPGKTEIFSDQIAFALTVGIKKERDGTKNIFVIPSDTTLKITSIVGANLGKDPITKKTHFSFGPSIHIGYDFLNQRPAMGVGFGLQYNLIKF